MNHIPTIIEVIIYAKLKAKYHNCFGGNLNLSFDVINDIAKR